MTSLRLINLRNSNFQRKPTSKKNNIVGRNLKEQYKRTRCLERIGKIWSSMREQ